MCEKIIRLIRGNYLFLIVISIALFLRFFDYPNRYILNQDQGRDASIALYCIRNNILPLIGSPSSAGPFNFGPYYFWIIMLFQKIFPFFLGPWFGFTLLATIAVYFYFKIGKVALGDFGAFVCGLIAASSPALVKVSTDMLNTVIIVFSSSAAFFFLALFTKNFRLIHLFLLSAFVGLSINFHFQSMGLLVIILFACLINNSNFFEKTKYALVGFLGLAITFTPLLIFNFWHHNIWVKSVYEYYTVGVKKFYVPVRWLTEIRDFWPQLYGKVIFGIPYLGYLILIMAIFSLFLGGTKRRIGLFWIVLGVSFVFQVVLMRFYRGPRSEEYLIAFYPFIILIYCWVVSVVYQYKRYLGVTILFFGVAVSLHSNYLNINEHPSQAKLVRQIMAEADNNRNSNVSVYRYGESDMIAMPVFYLLYYENRISDDGERLGLCDGNKFQCPDGESMNKQNYKVYYLDKDSNISGFSEITPKWVYEILMVNYRKG